MESVPLYNAVTGEGSEYKREMKAMTNAAIIFTVFVFGGSAHYILKRLDLNGDGAQPKIDLSKDPSARLALAGGGNVGGEKKKPKGIFRTVSWKRRT